jgi:hypothetical protein
MRCGDRLNNGAQAAALAAFRRFASDGQIIAHDNDDCLLCGVGGFASDRRPYLVERVNVMEHVPNQPFTPLVRPRCDACHFFVGSQGTNTGQCRRFPPHPATSMHSYFPEPQRGHWCGEWKEREKQAPVETVAAKGSERKKR